MCVSAGGSLARNLALGDFTDEHHVAAQILLLHHLAGEHGIAVLGQVVKSVAAALCSGEILKLIDFPASLHTEGPKKYHCQAKSSDFPDCPLARWGLYIP